MRPARSQRGLAAAAIIVVIILAVAVVIFGRGAFRKELLGLSQRDVTEANFRQVADALVAFASLNRRLPCPAHGSLDTGEADPDNATTACASPEGVVPWKSLALRREVALDGWGRKISYRVFDGASGFTQADGASMTNCNTSLGAPIDAALASGSLCKAGSPPPNTPAQYFAARGSMLVVMDTVTTRTGNAFVLISHGETGYGAYLTGSGGSRALFPDVNGREYTNAQAGGTYWILPGSAPGTPADDAAHFDDVVAYVSASALVAGAKLAARSWSQFPLSAQFTGSAVEAAAPGFSSGLSQDTGRTSLAMGGFLVTASSSGTQRNVGFREQDGIGGIGVIGGSSSSGDLNSAFGEKLTFQLGEGSEFGKMDVALNAFQITDYFPLQRERAEISFLRAGEPLQTAIVNAWDDQSDPSRCLFRLVSGGVFDRMDVAPLDQTGGGGNSRFTVAAIKACTDPTTPCTTAVSGAVACPIPPPSAASNAATGISATAATLRGTVEDNGVSKGSGSGYLTTGAGFSVGTRPLPLTSGSGTILAGNCVTVAGDGNTYVVSTGITAPGTLVLAAPGLRQSIPSSPTAVTVVQCQTALGFDYGLTCAYGTSVAATPATVNAGAGSTGLSASVAGLACNTSYYFRSSATGPGGTTKGGNAMLTTAACAFPTPVATTSPPTLVDTTEAQLNGVVNDNGAATTVTFDYGLTSCHGSSAAATPGTIAAGAGPTAVVAALSGLACDTHYHYRVRAVSSAGTTTGADTVFRTAPCP